MRVAIDTIKKNREYCGSSEEKEIRRGDAFALLAAQLDKKFKYIYIPPPQYKEMWSKALKLADENIEWLTDNGTVIVQIDPSEYQKIELSNLEENEQRKYGKTLLVFYDRK